MVPSKPFSCSSGHKYAIEPPSPLREIVAIELPNRRKGSEAEKGSDDSKGAPSSDTPRKIKYSRNR